MDNQNLTNQNLQLFHLASKEEVVPTPFYFKLPVFTYQMDDDEPVLIIGGRSMIYDIFMVKDVYACPLQSITSPTTDTNSVWSDHRNGEKNDITDLQQTCKQQDNAGDDLHDENCSDLSLNLLEEPIDLCKDLETQLKIDEAKTGVDSRSLQKGAHVNQTSKTARVYKHRKWKWVPPNIDSDLCRITSRNEFKLVFYCIHLKDPKRVYSCEQIRKMLRKLGYNGEEDYGPLNSARSHLKHFKRCDGQKPQGNKGFWGMVRNDKKYKQFDAIADLLVKNLD